MAPIAMTMYEQPVIICTVPTGVPVLHADPTVIHGRKSLMNTAMSRGKRGRKSQQRWNAGETS